MTLEEIRVGQVWRHKRNRRRTVTIERVHDDYVSPRRNTSRRKQAISFKTLRREYELSITDARVVR